jgi:HNH endonuclease
MTPTLTPSPSRGHSPDFIGPVVHGLWLGVTASAWTIGLAVLLAIGLVVRIFRFFRWLTLTSSPRDPQRLFAGADRAAIMRRAGGRCEFHGLFGGRCVATGKLQADHIHPHSRGGATTVGNGQALCKRHNKAKAAHIPFEWQVRRTVKRRASYFPIGESPAVARRQARAVTGLR